MERSVPGSALLPAPFDLPGAGAGRGSAAGAMGARIDMAARAGLFSEADCLWIIRCSIPSGLSAMHGEAWHGAALQG